MDLMGVFQQVGRFFVKLCAVSFYFGDFQISVGAVFVFCLAIGLAWNFIVSLGD